MLFGISIIFNDMIKLLKKVYCKPVIYYVINKVSIWIVWEKDKINKKIDYVLMFFYIPIRNNLLLIEQLFFLKNIVVSIQSNLHCIFHPPPPHPPQKHVTCVKNVKGPM